VPVAELRSGQASGFEKLRDADLAPLLLCNRKVMHELPYGFGKLLDEVDFDTAVQTVVEALAEQGFGVFTQVDVQKALRATREVAFRRYVILGVCDPVLAGLALESDPHIGLLLLCNVGVQEGAGSGLSVAVTSPRAMFGFADHPEMKSIAIEAERRLRQVVDGL